MAALGVRNLRGVFVKILRGIFAKIPACKPTAACFWELFRMSNIHNLPWRHYSSMSLVKFSSLRITEDMNQ